MDEVEWIVHPNGHIEGYSNWQGVLNNAYRLEGRNSLFDNSGTKPGQAPIRVCHHDND